MSVWPGVLLWLLAPHLACSRYKVRHARLVGGDSGTKFATHGLLTAAAVQSSPCMGKTCQIGPFWASRASFIPKWPGVILVGDVVSLWRSLSVQLSASRGTRAPQPALRRVHRPLRRRRLVCRRAQRAPGVVKRCYALSASDSCRATSPCTLGWRVPKS